MNTSLSILHNEVILNALLSFDGFAPYLINADISISTQSFINLNFK